MVGVGLSTKDDNLRNGRWQLRSWQKIKYKTKGSESRVVITALLDSNVITSTDDDSSETEDNYYCYCLLNVITFILLQYITFFCMIIIVLG